MALILLYICGIFCTIKSTNPCATMKTTFASYVKNARINAGLTLRDFCKMTGSDPSNWSKIERGVNKPPQSKLVIDQIAEALNFEPGGEDYKALIDLAAISAIPENLIDPEIKEQLPIFFRTARGQEPTDEELDQLVQKIRSAWTQEN